MEASTSAVRDTIVKTLKDKGYEYQGECNWGHDTELAHWMECAVNAHKADGITPPNIQQLCASCVGFVEEKCRDRKFWVHVYFYSIPRLNDRLLVCDMRVLK